MNECTGAASLGAVVVVKKTERKGKKGEDSDQGEEAVIAGSAEERVFGVCGPRGRDREAALADLALAANLRAG